MGITYVLWQWALRYAENTSRVGNLIFISPFCSLVLIHFVLGRGDSLGDPSGTCAHRRRPALSAKGRKGSLNRLVVRPH